MISTVELAVLVFIDRSIPHFSAFTLAIERSGGDRAIIDLISTIVVYKFSELSREEVDAMLGIELQ